MEIFKTIIDVQRFIQSHKISGKSIGFIPTMGALHQGHLSLIDKSKSENDITISSIFVNPIQFNDAKDYEKYPRTESNDCNMLLQHGCDAVFIPSVDEIYKDKVDKKFHFGSLELVMEGAHRPGHFNGVGVIVSKLFQILNPDKAYFGEKDYQQLKIIQELVKIENIPVKIIPCPTLREVDGLAMSSRNTRLTEEQREVAPLIYKTLKDAILNKKNMNVSELKQWVENQLNKTELLHVEYFEIADENSLNPVISWEDSPNIRGFIAVFCGEVRLIDNIRFI